MNKTVTAQDSLHTIEHFLSDVEAQHEKMAGDKVADAHTEPGSQGGPTSHPVKDVDDRTEAAQEGERSSENTADVKEDQGAPSVENAPTAKSAMEMPAAFKENQKGDDDDDDDDCDEKKASTGTAADDHMQLGTNIQATGDDPQNETNKAKAGKEDPGTSHPAKTTNDSLDGHKYAQDELDKMDLGELSKLASDHGNDFLAYIAVASDNQLKQAAESGASSEPSGSPSAPAQPAAPTKSASAEDTYRELASHVGWDLAGLVTGNFDKQAADTMVEQTMFELVKGAADNADRVALYLNSYQDTLNKQAMGPEMMGGGAAPPPPMPEGGEPGGDPAAMLGALGGGAPPEMGGGAPPEMGGAGPEGGAPPMDLASIIEQLGISEEELMEAIAAEEGGGEGGEAPPEMGGAGPEGGDPPAEPPMQVEAGDKEALDYIKEIVSRSRAKKAAARA